MRVELRLTEANGSVVCWIAETGPDKVVVKYGRVGTGLKSDVHPGKGNPDVLLLQLRDKKLSEGKGFVVFTEDLTPSELTTPGTQPTKDNLHIWLPSGPAVHDALVMLTAVFDLSFHREINDASGTTYGIGQVGEDLMVRWSMSSTSKAGFARVFVTDETVHQQMFLAAVAARLRIPIAQTSGKIMGEPLAGEDFLDERRSQLPSDVVALLIEARVLCDGNLLVGAFA